MESTEPTETAEPTEPTGSRSTNNGRNHGRNIANGVHRANGGGALSKTRAGCEYMDVRTTVDRPPESGRGRDYHIHRRPLRQAGLFEAPPSCLLVSDRTHAPTQTDGTLAMARVCARRTCLYHNRELMILRHICERGLFVWSAIVVKLSVGVLQTEVYMDMNEPVVSASGACGVGEIGGPHLLKI